MSQMSASHYRALYAAGVDESLATTPTDGTPGRARLTAAAAALRPSIVEGTLEILRSTALLLVWMAVILSAMLL